MIIIALCNSYTLDCEPNTIGMKYLFILGSVLHGVWWDFLFQYLLFFRSVNDIQLLLFILQFILFTPQKAIIHVSFNSEYPTPLF